MTLPRAIVAALRAAVARAVRSRRPDFLVGPLDDPYLQRWWLVPRNRVFNVYLHHFRHSDDDRALHDHPWAFCSVLLSGGYREITPIGKSGTQQLISWRDEGSVAFCPATHTHRVELIDNRACWTLFITGPRVRNWGFHCPHGWVPWQVFTKPGAEGEIGRGCGETFGGKQ
ncbi:MAG TPA: hypothetical protein VF292_03070 [Rhodanobacteraceae bacterium]